MLPLLATLESALRLHPLAQAFALLSACDGDSAEHAGTPAQDSSPVGGDSAAGLDTDTSTDGGFVIIPAGTFDMGGTPGQPDNGYGVHAVTLTHAYFVGVTEVTQGQFAAVMGYNPAYFTDCDILAPDNCPVEQVNWHEAAAYANAVSDAAGLAECYSCTGSGPDVECDVRPDTYDCTGYRLLTEAEWEGAARCGADTLYAGSDNWPRVAWINDNCNDTTHAVAGLDPNACGLYDMSGNVTEWTHDAYGDYPSGPVTDPLGAEPGDGRVARGGGCNAGPGSAVVSYRIGAVPRVGGVMGFRLARSSL